MSQGYFRLVGKIGDDLGNADVIDVIVKKLPVTLGRNDASETHVTLASDKISNAISRVHAKIDWDEEKSEYFLEILGKNKCVVDKKIHQKGEKVPLACKSTIKFSNVRIYFLLPDPGRPAAAGATEESTRGEGIVKGYSEYVSIAFDTIGKEDRPLSSKSIIDWATETFPELKYQKRINLYQGVSSVLKRKYDRLGGELADRNAYLYKRRASGNDDPGAVETRGDDKNGSDVCGEK